MSAMQRGVTADPKRAAIERAKNERALFIKTRDEAMQRAKDARKARLQRAAEVETCYRQHVPRQIFHADEMLAGSVFNVFDLGFDNGRVEWDENDQVVCP